MSGTACSYDPRALLGQPIGMLHCPECGVMVVAGLPHPPDVFPELTAADITNVQPMTAPPTEPCPLCGTDSPPTKDAPGGFSCPKCDAFFGEDKGGKYIHTGDVVRQLTEAFEAQKKERGE